MRSRLSVYVLAGLALSAHLASATVRGDSRGFGWPEDLSQATPPPPLPDLSGEAVPRCTVSLVAADGFDHEPVSIIVRNDGTADARAFTVTAKVGRASWRVDGLAAGATVRLAPQTDTGDYVLIDEDNEVAELNEANNGIPVPFVTCLPPRGLLLPALAVTRS